MINSYVLQLLAESKLLQYRREAQAHAQQKVAHQAAASQREEVWALIPGIAAQAR